MPTGETVNLKEKVRHLSDKPGVYLMKDRLGRIIYVGKAKNLKSCYFGHKPPLRCINID